MNKKLVIAVSLIFSILFLTQTSVVLAAKPIPVSFSPEFYTTGNVRWEFKNNKEIMTARGAGSMVGDIVGNFIWTEIHTRIYSPIQPEDLKLIKISVTFEFESATIGTKSGTFAIVFEEVFKPDTYGKRTTWKIVNGTDDFAKLHGKGIVVGFPSHNFEGTIHFS